MEYPHFVGGSYPAQAVTADQEETFNWYVEPMEVPGGSSRASLLPTPGVSSLATAPTGPGRGHFFDGTTQREFAVIGNKVWEINSTGTLTEIGTVTADSNPATISSNGAAGGQLFITSGGNGYLLTLSTSALTTITALSGKATMGDFLDGYFLCLESAASKVWISDLNDGATSTRNLDRPGGGDIWAMTVAEYERASFGLRARYRVYRNPIVLFLIGPVYVFLVNSALRHSEPGGVGNRASSGRTSGFSSWRWR